MLPSSVAGGAGGVIDATQDSTFVANLNASSWIDAYQLIVRRNTAENQIVYNTGVVQLSERFYPTDSAGKVVPLEITVPASSALLQFEKVNIGTDNKTVFVTMNMAIQAVSGSVASGISLSTDGGDSWNGTASNSVVGATIQGCDIKITFADTLSGKNNIVKIAHGTIKPTNDHYQNSAEDIVTSTFFGFLEESLYALHMSSLNVCAGTSALGSVEGNMPGYRLSRNAVVSVVKMGTSVDIASRTQADNKVSYTILDGVIDFHIGVSVAAGDYIFTYTDNNMSGHVKSVTSTVSVLAASAVTYTDVEIDDGGYVVLLTMSGATSNATASLEALVAAIQLSTDGGLTFTGTTTNPVTAIGFTNVEGTYSKAAIHNMRIEFAHALAGENNVVRIPADSIKVGTTKNTQLTTPFISIRVDTGNDDGQIGNEDVFEPISNSVVNGYANGYKWTLRIWNGYDASDPTLNFIESFESCFDAKDTPVVAIFGAPSVGQRESSWGGTYVQGQGVPIRWSRWKLKTGGRTVSDTGNLYSNSSLAYSYDGLMADASYTLILTCMTQDGVEVSAEHSFIVEYTTLDSNGVTRVMQRPDGAIEFQCAQPIYITGIPSGEGYLYRENTPVMGHTSIETDGVTTIEFESTIDHDLDISGQDTLVIRMHSVRDGEVLRWQSDDRSTTIVLLHRGLANGLVPSTDLYPSHDLYPIAQKFGEFVLIVNGEVVSIADTPNYGLMWYTLYVTTTSLTVSAIRLG